MLAAFVILISLTISWAQWTEPELLSENLDGWREPWISNDSMRIYVSNMVDIYISTPPVWPGGWPIPIRLSDHINEIGDVRSPCESPTGDTLYFTSWDFVSSGGWDVYFCVRTDTGWGEVQNIGAPVSTNNHEESVGISRDGSFLLVQSNSGVFYHVKQENGSWGPRISFGVGSPGEFDRHPCLSPDNTRLFFDRRDPNHGDIWESRLEDGIWQAPVPLPNPLINGTMTQESGACMMNDGRTLIFRKEVEPFEYRLFYTIDTTVSAIDEQAYLQPTSFELSVFPNPFNSISTISLTVPWSAREVEIALVNSLGQVVKTARVQAAGGMASYANDMSGFASGVYFVRAQAGDYAAAKRIVLVK